MCRSRWSRYYRYCVDIGAHCQVVDDGDPHVGVRLEAEGQDGDADEEHGDDPDTLT